MPKLFLVEDNAADVDLFRLALETADMKCELVVFVDGCEITDYIRQHDGASGPSVPELIILDLNLPKLDGLEVLQSIRDTPAFAKVPVAVLSSSSSFRDRGRLAELQVAEYIVKPADLDEYLKIGDTVRKLLERRQTSEGVDATVVASS
jgi:DNA-binding response OmpR family regulator